jgi:hypothetical protein
MPGPASNPPGNEVHVNGVKVVTFAIERVVGRLRIRSLQPELAGFYE